MNNVVEQAVLKILSDILGRNATQADLDIGMSKGLSIIPDDLSFRFIPELEARLGVSATYEEWLNVNTGREVIHLFESLLKKQ